MFEGVAAADHGHDRRDKEAPSHWKASREVLVDYLFISRNVPLAGL